MISNNSKESINHKEAYSRIPNIPSETSSIGHTRIIDYFCTPAPSSGIGIYTFQPNETHRFTPTMLMEIIIQPKTQIKKMPMANTHTR